MSLTRTLVAFPASIVLAFAAFTGCSSSAGSAGGESGDSAGNNVPPDVPANAPTFHKDVEPILQKSCMSCHAPGNIAPFSLLTYKDAKVVAGAIAQSTKARKMPPWGAQETAECEPRLKWKADPRLTEAEIAILDAWNKAGAPEGDPKDAPPAFVPHSLDLPGKNIELTPKTPFVASGDQDQFRCFVMDPGLTEDSYLQATRSCRTTRMSCTTR